MNISAPAIERPVATTLLTACLAAGGRTGLHAASRCAAAADRFSGHLRRRGAARRQSGDHGFLGGDSAGAAVRPHRRHQPDDLVEPAWLHRRHHAVRPGSQHRCGGARCAGRHQRGPRIPAGRSAQQPDLPQDQSGRRSRHDSGHDLRRHDPGPDVRRGRFHHGPEAGAGGRSGPGICMGLVAAGGPHRSESQSAEQAQHRPGSGALRGGVAERQHRQRLSGRRQQDLDGQGQRSTQEGGRLQAHHRRLPKRRRRSG